MEGIHEDGFDVKSRGGGSYTVPVGGGVYEDEYGLVHTY
jgi:hypothetical protein